MTDKLHKHQICLVIVILASHIFY